MKRIGPVVAKVHWVERLETNNGNDRWAVIIQGMQPVSEWGYEDDGFRLNRTYTTRANVNWVYGVDFYELAGEFAYIKYHITKAGRLVLDYIKKKKSYL